MYFFRYLKNGLFFLLYALIVVCGFYACASIGTPLGGDEDVTPPRFVKSNPAPNSIRFNQKKIELFFDEYISIEKPSEKVIITPPQQKMPTIKAIGKKIAVALKDSLILDVTYTFDFTNGIVDNNEKNAIEGFSFAFSTGDVVDSLIVSGLLLNAANQEPMPNVMVGLHVNLDDSAFTSLPFLRTTMTNDRGKFFIRNVAPGTYRLFALTDMNRNYRFDPPNETLAFYDSLIVPSFEPAIRMDTLMKDSLTVDTIKEVHYTRFTPDNIVLQLFKEDFDTQYLSKTERPSNHQLVFHFNSNKALPPAFYLFEDEDEENDENEGEEKNERNKENEKIAEKWFLEEYSSDKKDITYWITDSLIYKRDTLRLKVDYLADDSLFNLVPHTDTLRFIWKNKETPKKEKKKKGEKEKEIIDFLKIEVSVKNPMDVFDTLKIVFEEPILAFDSKKIQIQQMVDSLWEDREFPIVGDTLNPRLFYVENQWPYGQEYRIKVDSAAFSSIYGKWNDSINTKFKFKTEEDYGVLLMLLTGIEVAGFGELLDNAEKVVRKVTLRENGLDFYDLPPGKYYLRFIEDSNGNGKWDTGSFSEKRQPENVYYYEEPIEIVKWREDEKHWNITDIPVGKQKPLEITKNKPVEKKPKRDAQNNRNQQGNNTNRSNSNSYNQQQQNNNNRSLQQNMPQMR
jgi:uncharacterized protein (DUF2141 family)